MFGDKTPSAPSLEKPEPFKEMMRKDRQDDCISCRVIGSGVFFGLAGYSYFSGMRHLEKQQQAILQRNSRFGMPSRKAGIVTISFALAYLGLWRAFN